MFGSCLWWGYTIGTTRRHRWSHQSLVFFLLLVLLSVFVARVCAAPLCSSPLKKNQRIDQPLTPDQPFTPPTLRRLTQGELAQLAAQFSPPSKPLPGAASFKSVDSSVIAKFCVMCCGSSGGARVEGVNHDQSEGSGTFGGESDATIFARNTRSLLEQDRQTVWDVDHVYNEIYQNRHWLRQFGYAGMPSRDKCLRIVFKKSGNVIDVSMTYNQLQRRVAYYESILQRGILQRGSDGITRRALSFGEHTPVAATRGTTTGTTTGETKSNVGMKIEEEGVLPQRGVGEYEYCAHCRGSVVSGSECDFNEHFHRDQTPCTRHSDASNVCMQCEEDTRYIAELRSSNAGNRCSTSIDVAGVELGDGTWVINDNYRTDNTAGGTKDDEPNRVTLVACCFCDQSVVPGTVCGQSRHRHEGGVTCDRHSFEHCVDCLDHPSREALSDDDFL